MSWNCGGSRLTNCMSEENNNGQTNDNPTNDWRVEIEANLARITKRLSVINKLHLREEFRAAQVRKESDERMTRFEADLAAFKSATVERVAAFESEAAERKQTLDYLVRLMRALGDKTLEHDDRLAQAGTILSGDAASKTGT